MSIQVNDFQWEPGKNDAEYIKLLKSSRDEWQKIAQKAIAKLKALSKAQESRVMTLEEIWKRSDIEPLYLEYRLPHEIKLRPAIFQPDNSDDGGGDGYMCFVSAWCASGFYNRKEHGKTWRCWTSRPTEEQRKATPWK